MTSGPDASQPRTLYLLRRLQVAAYLHMEGALKPFEITPTQYMVMSSLATRGRSSSAQLSRRFQVRPQSMIKLILGLEAADLVERVAREDDRRVLEISLSRKGQNLLTKCEAQVDALEARMLAVLPDAELVAMRAAMGKILESIQTEGAEPLDKPV